MKHITKAEYDQYGDDCKTLAPYQSTITRKEGLRKKIVAAHEDKPADLPCTAEGERWTLMLSPRKMKRIFKPGAIKRLAAFLGDTFYKIADVGFGDFDEHVTILDRSKYVVEEQTGHRTIEAVEKPAARKAA